MDQLEKVLALADSDHEGEALVAIRMARRLMEREGLRFTDLALALRKPGFSFRPSFFSGAQLQLEAQVEQLQDDLAAHVEQNESLTTQMTFWRQRAQELEQLLNLNQAETARWKNLARETAERLWELGRATQAQAFLSETAAAVEAEEEALEAQEDAAPPPGKQRGHKKRHA